MSGTTADLGVYKRLRPGAAGIFTGLVGASTRAEAKARGLKRYFTGKPCKAGHVAERRCCISPSRPCRSLPVLLLSGWCRITASQNDESRPGPGKTGRLAVDLPGMGPTGDSQIVAPPGLWWYASDVSVPSPARQARMGTCLKPGPASPRADTSAAAEHGDREPTCCVDSCGQIT